MKIQWTPKAEKELDKILSHTMEHFSLEKARAVYLLIRESLARLEEFPELGRKVGGHFHKRYLVIEGNVFLYEIFLQKVPTIVIRNIRPRKSEGLMD